MTTGYASPVGGALIGGTAPLSFTSAASTAQVDSNVKVEWDFDNDGDFDQAVEDITSYVRSAQTSTGRDFPSSLTGRAGPGKLKLTLTNDDDRFSYFNTASPLNVSPFSLKTGRKIRVRTTDGVLGAGTISYVGIGAVAVGNNASVVPALPTGLQSADRSIGRNADLMIIAAAIRNSGTGTVNTPDGWTPWIVSGNFAILAKYYEAGDTAPTVTFTGGVANATTQAQCFAYRDVHQTLSRALTGSIAQLNGAATNVAVPGLVGPDDNVTTVLAVWRQGTGTSINQLSGQFMTEISDSPTATGDDAYLEIQYRLGGGVNFKTFSSTTLTVTGGTSVISRAIVFQLTGAVARPDPVLLVRDRFTRSINSSTMGNAETGQTWLVSGGGGFGIRDGRAEAPAPFDGGTTGVSILETIETGTTDHYVQGSIPMQVQDGRVGLIARYLDANNYVRCYYDGADRSVTLEERVAGVTTLLSAFAIEAWDGMTMGLGVANQKATIYLGGTPLDTANLTRAVTGTSAGLYGLWETHSDVRPAVDDFYVWDRVREDIDGVIWTGYVTKVKPTVKVGELKTAELTAEGPLLVAAVAGAPAPRIPRIVGESDSGLNHSVPAGCIVGDIMARANLLHPPHPLPTNPLSHLGPHAVDDGKALELARQVELTERGFMRETVEGAVVFEDRDYRDGRSSSAWFSDTPHVGQYPITEIDPFDEQTQIVNQAVARVAPTCPTVVDVTNQADSDPSVLDVLIVVPDVAAGDLVLVFIACSADATDVEFGCPPPWKSHRDLRQREGNGMRIFSLICDGSESGDVVAFYKGTTLGSYIAHIYTIRDWYGTDDGIKLGRVSPATNAYPVTPGWSRAPALYIVFQCAIGSSAGILWGPLDTPPPVGYDYLSLEGLVFVTASPAFETGVESVYKLDVTDTEQPRAWENVFQDALILETVCVAVRGYDGPLQKATIDNPKAVGGEGLYVVVDDVDSQHDHNIIRTNQDVPALHYTEADARDWCDGVIADFSTDRPIVTISFIATKTAALRLLAMRLRVSHKITLTATGNAGLGIEGDFWVEAKHDSFSHGVKLWVTTLELSPA